MNIAWLHKSRHNKTGGSSSGWINRVAGETDHRSKMGDFKWVNVRDRAPDPFYDVGPNPREWVELCYCLLKWRFD